MVDGHDFKALIDAFNSAKYIKQTKNKSVVVHVKTTKGWGYIQDTDGTYHYTQLGINHAPDPNATGSYIAEQLMNRSKTKQDYMIVSPSITDYMGLRDLKMHFLITLLI